jgi:hypothetical protein
MHVQEHEQDHPSWHHRVQATEPFSFASCPSVWPSLGGENITNIINIIVTKLAIALGPN